MPITRNTLLLCAIITAFAMPAPAQASDNSFWGTALGGSLGGYLGSTIGKGSGRLAATGAGVFLGATIGNNIGHSMDRANANYGRSYYPSYQPSFNSYQPTYVAPEPIPQPRIIYVEPQIIEYRRVPTPVYVEEGYVGPQPPQPQQHCREFTQTIKIDGQIHESFGTACLRPDGTWQIQQ